MNRPVINSCTRCNGTGYIGKWKHIANGICFECQSEHGYVRGEYQSSHRNNYRSRVARMKDKYAAEIKAKMLPDSDSILSAAPPVNSETFNTMCSLAEEGFDDEVLYDLAHQMRHSVGSDVCNASVTERRMIKEGTITIESCILKRTVLEIDGVVYDKGGNWSKSDTPYLNGVDTLDIIRFPDSKILDLMKGDRIKVIS
ncbi:hypothetical protein [Vibrio breoganii]|uniref:hypothetical protein n=1 Tax=Vibrio breoganii TaxID=553239 RepID=UPI000C83E5D9|nr:hypothetical protein [Vibrio breoganii]PMO81114.1 hypothetical protein BCT00_12265 [Vibrio breoganii]